jgi:hypothetical protein
MTEPNDTDTTTAPVGDEIPAEDLDAVTGGIWLKLEIHDPDPT